jgi:beta-lactamase class A
MIQFKIIILIILFFSNMFPQNILILKSKISSIFKSLDGDFAIAFKIISDEKNEILIDEKRIFHAASTMKTPVMIEVFKQAAKNKFNLDDSIEIKNAFKSIVDDSLYSLDITDDSGEELYSFIGKRKTIRELVFDMITVSNNLATNILIELVGARNITQTMRSIGANDIQVLRGVEDDKAFQLGLNNIVTAYDLMLIYENLANHKFVNAESSKEMINILLQQKHNTRIPAKLPHDVKVAHKTGSITGVGHDSGIVFLPDGRKYVLVLLSKNVKDEKTVIEAQAEVSKIIYEFVVGI